MYENEVVEDAWLTLAQLSQREWEAYVDADLTFLMGYASCDRFAEAALILRRMEGNGLAEKMADDDAEAGQVWCDHPEAMSAPDQERQAACMKCLREVWG